ncbi:MAG TPA: DUF4405 domain-containing protein [Gammaproteobacteria bacterium]|nr:DUF4405 domain-containing protein [Gammaproteobacteria bacterium]
MADRAAVKVWDPVVRLFHWGVVTAFTVAYVTEDEGLGVHVWAGYTLAALLLVRLLWGFVGRGHARFADFSCSPAVAWRYVKALFSGRARRYLGHNPAGAWMIFLMLAVLAAVTVSGLMVYGADQGAGPLGGMLAGSPEGVEHLWEEIHEFAAHFALVLVMIHIAGVVVASIVHKENLVGAMWHGCKRGEGPGPAGARHGPCGRSATCVLMVLVSATLLLAAWGGGWARADHDEARRRVEAGDIVPLSQIIAAARARYPGGRLLEAELEPAHDGARYEVELLDAGGRVHELLFDAVSGRYLGLESDEFYHRRQGREDDDGWRGGKD